VLRMRSSFATVSTGGRVDCLPAIGRLFACEKKNEIIWQNLIMSVCYIFLVHTPPRYLLVVCWFLLMIIGLTPFYSHLVSYGEPPIHARRIGIDFFCCKFTDNTA
jgi:hypothetical protein